MPLYVKDETKDTGEVPEKEKLPSKEKAWEEVMKRVEEIDGGMAKGWKEDIDTLLVFAGLFSAVVTAFTIESYQWLSEDPADQNIAILTQISAQLNNRNATSFEPTSFTPSPSVVRINVFWFLSLILALVDALFGLMCKQWLREYRRPTKTRSPEQWLSLRCFRSESFERWHVPSFLAALPIILEVALFFFFAGLLELLWTKHRTPFAFAVIIIGFAITFYIATTLLPGIEIIRLVFRVHPGIHSDGCHLGKTMSEIPEMDYMCPYKSPQAWAVFKLLTSVFRPSSPFSRQIILHYLKKKFHEDFSQNDSVRAVRYKLQDLRDWFSVDLDVIERFPRFKGCPDIYGLKAHRWLTHEFRDIPLMIPHLQTLLQALPPQLVMPGIFDCNICRLDREWITTDIDNAFFKEDCSQKAPTPFGYSKLQLRLLTFHFIWTTDVDFKNCRFTPPWSWNESYLFTPRERFLPLTRIFQMILENDTRTMALPCITHFMQHPADIHRDASSFDFESIVPLFGPLATVDLRSDIKGQLVDLLTLINATLRGETYPPDRQLSFYSWIDGMDTFGVGPRLPRHRFDRHTGYFPVSMDRVNTLLCNHTTNAIALEYINAYYEILDTDYAELYYLFLQVRRYVLHYIPDNLDGFPPHLREVLETSTQPSGTPANELPYLLTSQEGLLFLRSLDSILKRRCSGRRRYDHRMRVWEVSLKCVAHLNGLPLDYFDTPNPLSSASANNVDASGGGGVAAAVGPSMSTIERQGGVDTGVGSSGPVGPLLTPLPQEIEMESLGKRFN
ncbi:hypothetical protein PQX77_005532 [Marasmius sp. AFHP31]|nr:hypothetical protein PQX77_005532 [Marasmius sp. AFHP31]